MLLNAKYAVPASGPEPENSQFPGSCTAISGLRYYSPSLGRFINRDPKEEGGGLNLYAFCLNNGVNAWDYLGMDVAMVDGFFGSDPWQVEATLRKNIGPSPFDDFVSAANLRLMAGLDRIWNTPAPTQAKTSVPKGTVKPGPLKLVLPDGTVVPATDANMGKTEDASNGDAQASSGTGLRTTILRAANGIANAQQTIPDGRFVSAGERAANLGLRSVDGVTPYSVEYGAWVNRDGADFGVLGPYTQFDPRGVLMNGETYRQGRDQYGRNGMVVFIHSHLSSLNPNDPNDVALSANFSWEDRYNAHSLDKPIMLISLTGEIRIYRPSEHPEWRFDVPKESLPNNGSVPGDPYDKIALPPPPPKINRSN